MVNKVQPHLKAGDKARLDWGVDHYVVTVMHVSGPRNRRHALIEIPVPGARGETLSTITASVPVDQLDPVEQGDVDHVEH